MVLQILNTCHEVVSESKDVKIVSSNIPILAEKVPKILILLFTYY